MDFEEIKKDQRKINRTKLRQSLNEDWVIEKINKYIERHRLNYSIEDVKKEILTSDLVASIFIKEPNKQNFTEKIISDAIKKNDLVENFMTSKDGEIFLENGKITKERKVGNKSIDFSWKTNGKNVFASQKYINESGGGQDNQFNDVKNFLMNAQNSNKDEFFIAIVDGKYFNQSKMNYLKSFEDDNIFVCSIYSLQEVLKKIE